MHTGMEPAGRQAEPLPRLSVGELRQLGMYRLAYVTAIGDDQGDVNFVVHGADGLAVAVVEEPGLAVDLAQQLGLVLVPLH